MKQKLVLILLLVCSLMTNAFGIKLTFYMNIAFRGPAAWSDWYGVLSEECLAYYGGISAVDKDFNKCAVEGCRAVLDSNFIIHTSGTEAFRYDESDEFGAYEFFGFNTAQHTPNEVLYDQFMGWQRCGFISYTKEETDSLLNRLFELKDVVRPNGINGIDDIVYDTPCISKDYMVDSVPDCMYPRFYRLEYPEIYEELVNEEKTSLERIDYTDNTPIVLNNRQVLVPENLIGKTYHLMDLNGRILQSGALSQNMLLPRMPVILKIQGYGEFYLK